VNCPKCNEKLKIESSMKAGIIWECLKCRDKFFVESPETGDGIYIWGKKDRFYRWVPYGIVERKVKVVFT